MRTLLVTNDFPPKLGGIQTYLEELWRRLDPERTSVLTASSHPDAPAYDATLRADGLVVERVVSSTLYAPTPAVRRAVVAAIARRRVDLVLFDPYVPLGLLGRLGPTPYGVVLHGAEVAIPARLPVVRLAARRVLVGASVAIAAGVYPEAEARRLAGPRLHRSSRSRPGSTRRGSTPLTEPHAGSRASGSGCPSTARSWPRSGGSSRARASTSSSRPSRGARPRSRA